MVGDYSTDFEMASKFLYLQSMMIHAGIVKGLTHPETIKYSQELDVLINHFQQINPVIGEHAKR